jgi:hypothetical protein
MLMPKIGFVVLCGTAAVLNREGDVSDKVEIAERIREWRKAWSHKPTPIPQYATGLWYSEECVDQMLADYSAAAEARVKVLEEALRRIKGEADHSGFGSYSSIKPVIWQIAVAALGEGEEP